jgi:hypothetical protein
MIKPRKARGKGSFQQKKKFLVGVLGSWGYLLHSSNSILNFTCRSGLYSRMSSRDMRLSPSPDGQRAEGWLGLGGGVSYRCWRRLTAVEMRADCGSSLAAQTSQTGSPQLAVECLCLRRGSRWPRWERGGGHAGTGDGQGLRWRMRC